MSNNGNGHHPEPSPADDNGRNSRGRFTPGNKFGKGNPMARRVQAVRTALLLEVKASDIRQAVRALIEQAKAGDRQALAEILDRTLGRPAQADVMERLERLEALLANRQEQTR